MKKMLEIIMVVFCMFSIVGCSGDNETDTAATSNTDDTISYYSSSETISTCAHNYSDATCTSPRKCIYCGETSGTANGHRYVDGYCTECSAVDPNYKVSYDVAYINDRKVQYESDDNKYIVFFGLQKADKTTYTSAAGTASIKITDGSTTLYNESISFTSSDFSYWTNPNWSTDKYLCGLYISRTKIKSGSKSSGTLSLKVELNDGTWFESRDYTISDLPVAAVSFSSIPSDIRATIIQAVEAGVASLDGGLSMYEGSLNGNVFEDEYVESAKACAKTAASDFGIAKVLAENYQNVVLSDGSSLYERLKKLESSSKTLSLAPNTSSFNKALADAKNLISLVK